MSNILDDIKIIAKLAAKQAEAITDDAEAYSARIVIQEWESNKFYAQGSYAVRGEQLYKCLLEHTSQDDWTPENSPSLWAEVLPGQPGMEIGEWKQPDSTNPYMKGDKVIHNGKTWVSDVDNNVWEPGVYGWSETNI